MSPDCLAISAPPSPSETTRLCVKAGSAEPEVSKRNSLIVCAASCVKAGAAMRLAAVPFDFLFFCFYFLFSFIFNFIGCLPLVKVSPCSCLYSATRSLHDMECVFRIWMHRAVGVQLMLECSEDAHACIEWLKCRDGMV